MLLPVSLHVLKSSFSYVKTHILEDALNVGKFSRGLGCYSNLPPGKARVVLLEARVF